MSLVGERFGGAGGWHTWSGGCLLEVGIISGLPKRPGGLVGWGRTFEEAAFAIEENRPKDVLRNLRMIARSVARAY